MFYLSVLNGSILYIPVYPECSIRVCGSDMYNYYDYCYTSIFDAGLVAIGTQNAP